MRRVAVAFLVVAVLVNGPRLSATRAQGIGPAPSKGNAAQSAALKTPPRPELPALDLADATACYRELGELAGFGFLDNSSHAYNASGVGIEDGLFAPDPAQQLDRVVRFDRLARSRDKDFRALVEQVRTLSTDNWRLNFLAHADAINGGAQGRLKTIVAGGVPYLAAVAHRSLLDPLFIPQPVDPNGRSITVEPPRETDPAIARADEAVRQAGDRIRELIRREGPRQQERLATQRQIFAARATIQLAMARLWVERIWPRLEAASGARDSERLLDFDSPYKLSPDLGFRQIGNFTRALFRPHAKVLHNLAVHVVLRDDRGSTMDWYGFRPEMKPSEFAVLYGDGEWVFLGNAAWSIEATLSYCCDEGKESGRTVMLTHASSRDRMRAAGPRPAVDDRVEIERQLATDRAGATAVLDQARQRYPDPQNPDEARRRLLEALEPGRVYVTSSGLGPQNSQISVTFDPIDTRAGTAAATMRSNIAGTGDVPLLGRFVEEVGRGCVLAFVPESPGALHLEVRDQAKQTAQTRRTEIEKTRESMGLPKRLGPDMTGNPGYQLGQKSRQKAEARAQQTLLASDKERLARWERGEIPILTQPDVIRDRYVPPIDPDFTPPYQVAEIHRAAFRMKASESARLVVFVRADGRLSAQFPPVSGDEFPIVGLSSRADHDEEKPAADDPQAGMPRFRSHEPGTPKQKGPEPSPGPAQQPSGSMAAKLAETQDSIQKLDFKNDPVKKPHKLAALAALKRAGEEVKAGRSPARNLEAALNELEALSQLGIQAPANVQRLQSAIDAIKEIQRAD